MTTIDLSTFQIEKGTNFTEYELPAPSPDYPIEIESVNDFGVVSSVGKENLLGQFNTIPHSYVNDSGQVISEGLPHSSHTDYIDISGTDSITFSLYDSMSDNDLELIKSHNTQKLMLFDKHRNVTGIPFRKQWIMPNSVTLNTHGAKYARLNLLFGTKYRYKLEKGDIKTDWTPATEDITPDSNHPLIDKVNFSLSEPLRSVGDVKDRIFRDNDGLWKVERNVEPIHPEDGTRTIEETYGVLDSPIYEVLPQDYQDKLNTLKSFKDSNYVYTVQNTDSPHKEQLKPTLHTTFNSKDYLKETRTITNLLIWARELTDEELIHHNQLFLNRFNLPSDRVIGEPIEQTLNLLHGGMVGHSLEQNYTINS